MSDKYYLIKATDIANLGEVAEEMFIDDNCHQYALIINQCLSRTVECNVVPYEEKVITPPDTDRTAER